MTTRQIVINIPEKVLIAEKTDEDSFAREISLINSISMPIYHFLFEMRKNNVVFRTTAAL
ncbi:hypothetical protein KAX02_12445 [candidate division WOR-3 bacterium]|nr:hypothetical protein [candidate division WOR-3 bacterium]